MRANELLKFAVISAALLTAGFACGSEGKPSPTCLAGVCVGKQAPTESALKSRYGGQSFELGHRTRGYCYELPSNGQVAHLLFVLKNFGDGWRVVSIRAAVRPICDKATPMKHSLRLMTGEGVALGGTADSVRAAYGDASHTIDPKSRVIAEIMSSKAQGIEWALQYVPVDTSVALSAVFVIAGDRVIAIEVSSDV